MGPTSHGLNEEVPCNVVPEPDQQPGVVFGLHAKRGGDPRPGWGGRGGVVRRRRALPAGIPTVEGGGEPCREEG